MAAPTIIGTPAFGELVDSGAAITLAVTVSGTGTNRALWAWIGKFGSGSSASVSCVYNTSETMTAVYTQNGSEQTGGILYYLANPTATTANIVATFATQGDIFIMAFVTQDTAQSSPVDVGGTANTSGATSISKEIVTTVDDTLCLSTWYFGGSADSPVPGTGQVDITTDRTLAGGEAAWSSEAQASAGAYTGSYTWTNSAGGDFYVVAIKGAVAPPATGTPNRGLNLLGIGQ